MAASTKDKTVVVPDPKNPALFEFLERQFADSNFPDKIELAQTFGPGGRQRGLVLDTQLYKPNSPKPQREAIVAMSNRFLTGAQRDCDTNKRPHKYAILIWNSLQSDKPIALFPLVCEPEQGLGGPGPDPDDDEGGGKDFEARDVLRRRMEKFNEDDRFRVELFATTVSQLIKTQQDMIQEARNHNKELMALWVDGVKTVHQTNVELFRLQQDAKYQEWKLGVLKDSVEMVRGLLPIAVSKMQGKEQQEAKPGTESTESIAIANFIKSLSDEQAHAVFGVWEDGARKQAGILTEDQCRLLDAVARCVQPPSALGALLEGPDAVRGDQIGALQKVLREGQFMPLLMLVNDIRAKAAAKSDPV